MFQDFLLQISLPLFHFPTGLLLTANLGTMLELFGTVKGPLTLIPSTARPMEGWGKAFHFFLACQLPNFDWLVLTPPLVPGTQIF